MTYTEREALNRTHAYEGEAHGVRYQCHAAHCAKGKLALTWTKLTDTGGFKGSADRLAEALNGRWTGRDRGYLLTPSRALLWRALFTAGWDAEMDWRGCYRNTKAPLFEAPDGRKLTLAEVVKEVRP